LTIFSLNRYDTPKQSFVMILSMKKISLLFIALLLRVAASDSAYLSLDIQPTLYIPLNAASVWQRTPMLTFRGQIPSNSKYIDFQARLSAATLRPQKATEAIRDEHMVILQAGVSTDLYTRTPWRIAIQASIIDAALHKYPGNSPGDLDLIASWENEFGAAIALRTQYYWRPQWYAVAYVEYHRFFTLPKPEEFAALSAGVGYTW